MGTLIALCIAFGLATAGSITILGDRQLLQGKTISLESAMLLLVDWRLWTSLALAIIARLMFIGTNVVFLRDPRWAENATTLTTFVTATAYIFVIVSNHLFLGETLGRYQILGAILTVAGIVVMMHRGPA